MIASRPADASVKLVFDWRMLSVDGAVWSRMVRMSLPANWESHEPWHLTNTNSATISEVNLSLIWNTSKLSSTLERGNKVKRLLPLHIQHNTDSLLHRPPDPTHISHTGYKHDHNGDTERKKLHTMVPP